MTAAERRARLRLARAEGIGAITARLLIARHGSARAAIAALPRLARGRPITLPDEAAAEAEEAALARLGARLLVLEDPDYPPALAALEDAPVALAVLGDPAQLARRCVAVVGARNASAGGRVLAERLARELAEAGIVVVSGLARGIDAAAHQGALAAGVTVAAVATGLDRPYPPEHAALQARIAEAGAVVAEAPPGTAALPRLFPRRNRIIAGLALGVVVVEAAPRSGSLITARLALEAGRELFAVPGSPLDPRARGANDLIRQGAHLVESAEDILAHLPAGPPAPPLRRPPALPREEKEEPGPEPHDEMTEAAGPPGDEVAAALAALATLLSPAPVTVDELIRRCPCSAPAVSAALLELDLEGRIERLPGNRVALASR
ncbi:DNA-processing protein DprA [Elioraea sp.]|uniref:DNA-processing protein DprA n=1 Tax=Elioraea sp. TaxID=2185103 RepID=UPI0021DE7B15|nr:DNA-processing protein DprA [Elioraea sp.]GIX12006.1 MAG: DNA processing protein DprA [Elioraea sp.]